MSKPYAIAIITGKTDHGLVGTFLEVYDPRADWQSYELRWAPPKLKPGTELQLTEYPPFETSNLPVPPPAVPQAPLNAGDKLRDLLANAAVRQSAIAAAKQRHLAGLKAKFDAAAASLEIGSLIAIPEARGLHDDAASKDYAAGHEFITICGPDRAEAIATDLDDVELDDDGIAIHISQRTAKLFATIPGADFDPGHAGFLHLIGSGDIVHEAAADAATREPDDAIIWISGPDKGIVLQHRGAFLFWQAESAGTDVSDFGFNELPADKGLYYLTGKGWSHTPYDHYVDDYDSGFDIATCEPATAAHLALCGVEPGGFDADIKDFEDENAEDPAPAPSA